MIPVLAGAEAVIGLLRGPLMKVLESYVSDLELKRRLQAELESAVLGALSANAALGADIVGAETRSEHMLTWAWRPALMVVLTGFLLLTGLVLPIADTIFGKAVAFEPRWAALPPGFWDFLSIGMGGYIGGRSLEKIAGGVLAKAGPGTPRRR